MIEMRRVKGFDGGNHLVSDVLQFRMKTEPPSPWQNVPVMEDGAAFIEDIIDGLEEMPTDPYRKKWVKENIARHREKRSQD